MRALKPIRLAVVSETYPPDINGVAMSLSRLIGGLLERGHCIDLYRYALELGDVQSRWTHLYPLRATGCIPRA